MYITVAKGETCVYIIVAIHKGGIVRLGQIVLFLLIIQFVQLKEIGNSYFTQGMYSKALIVYLQALNCCCEHNMKEQMALIHSYCAMTCLELQWCPSS